MRFRPILMTSLAFVLGMLPMVLASGPGSASRHSIGTGVFFGMLVAITVGIVLVPFFFVLIYKIKGKSEWNVFFVDNKKIITMKRNTICIHGLSLTLALSSCKIGKKYARPELDLPEEIVAGADTASIDSIPWQSLYADTTLQRLITIALDNNKDMKIAAAKIKR